MSRQGLWDTSTLNRRCLAPPGDVRGKGSWLQKGMAVNTVFVHCSQNSQQHISGLSQGPILPWGAWLDAETCWITCWITCSQKEERVTHGAGGTSMRAQLRHGALLAPQTGAGELCRQQGFGLHSRTCGDLILAA